MKLVITYLQPFYLFSFISRFSINSLFIGILFSIDLIEVSQNLTFGNQQLMYLCSQDILKMGEG